MFNSCSSDGGGTVAPRFEDRLSPQVDPALRRIRSADGLDPAGPAPAAVWEELSVTVVADGQYRLRVPCVLPSAATVGVDSGLTAALRGRWVRPLRPAPPCQVTDVVAAFDRPGRRTVLTLAISARQCASPGQVGLDDLRTGRELNDALAELFAPRQAIEIAAGAAPC